jgi:sialate O-acetylesterase
MVLQRDTKVKIWGWATPSENVTIEIAGQKLACQADKTGKWFVFLSPQKAGGPFSLTIKGENTLNINNILFGDVWLCSGQSNMELPMQRVAVIYPNEIASSENSAIRQFQVPVRWNYAAPQTDIDGGTWKAADPQNVLQFSAVGYFFARELYAKTKVPVGIILCAAGGSCAEGWISEESLKKFPPQYQDAKQLQDSTFLQNLITTERNATANWFKYLTNSDLGYKNTAWSNAKIDDSNWSSMQIPSSFKDANIAVRSGVVWFRKDVTLPENCAGKPALLEMGRIVDSDSVFINGQFVGTTSYQYPPRRYKVAAGILKAGTNTIVVRVISQVGGGSFIPDKPYQLTVDNQTIDLKGAWKYQIGATCNPSPASTYFPGKPLGLYNAMLHPLQGYGLKGVIWYQGEANADHYSTYTNVLSTLIYEWRKCWNMPDLPFLCVQLPDFGKAENEPSNGSWAYLREQQLKTLSVPNTALVVSLGLGEWNDIHPLRKKEIGERLALAAQNVVYKDNKIIYSGPLYSSMKVKGKEIELSFSQTQSGLSTKDGKELSQFAIAGADQKFVWAKAKIVGNKIVVWSDQIQSPVAVRYAWADNPAGANLCNKEGLPASPFRTDSW